MQMTFSPLENEILLEVVNQPRGISYLYAKYVNEGKISRAGFYKVIASLKRKEVVLVKGKFVSVNKIWLATSQRFFQNLVNQKSKPSYLAERVAMLEEKDGITYEFKNMAEIDIFILNLLHDLALLRTGKVILISEQYEFFILLNQKRTQQILGELKTMNVPVYLLVAGQNEINREIARKYLRDAAQGHVPDKPKQADPFKVIHIIGDIIVELQLDKKFVNEIRKLYERYEKISERFIDELRNIVDRNFRHRILIYKSKARADKLHGHFRKYFPIA